MRHAQLAGARAQRVRPNARVVRRRPGSRGSRRLRPGRSAEKIERPMISAGRAGRGDPPLGQHDHRRREPRDLGDRMADIDDRHRAPRRAAARYRAGSRPCAPRRARPSGSSITSRRGLRQQRAADRDALLLAARQIRRPAAQQMRRCRAIRRHGRIRRRPPRSSRREPAAVEQVLPHASDAGTAAFLET